MPRTRPSGRRMSGASAYGNENGIRETFHVIKHSSEPRPAREPTPRDHWCLLLRHGRPCTVPGMYLLRSSCHRCLFVGVIPKTLTTTSKHHIGGKRRKLQASEGEKEIELTIARPFRGPKFYFLNQLANLARRRLKRKLLSIGLRNKNKNNVRCTNQEFQLFHEKKMVSTVSRNRFFF